MMLSDFLYLLPPLLSFFLRLSVCLSSSNPSLHHLIRPSLFYYINISPRLFICFYSCASSFISFPSFPPPPSLFSFSVYIMTRRSSSLSASFSWTPNILPPRPPSWPLLFSAPVSILLPSYDRSCSQHPPPLSRGVAPPLSRALPCSLASEDSRQALHSTSSSFTDRER